MAIVEPLLPPEGAPAPRHQPLVILFAAAATGIVADRYLLPQPFFAWAMAAVSGMVLWLCCYRWRVRRAAALCLLAACAALFGAWHHAWWRLYPADEIGLRATIDAAPVILRATALSNVRWLPAPERDALRVIPQGDRSRLAVAITAVRDGDEWQTASGRATLVVEGHVLGVQAGDELEVLAQMQRLPPPQNPGEFDAEAYGRASRELVRLIAPSPDCVRVLARGSFWNFARRLGALRDTGQEVLWRQMGSQRAGLAAGLLVNAREQMDADQTQQFFVTGTIHILAISGMHVGLLTGGFWLVMRTGILSRRSSIAAAIGFVLVYSLVTDWQPPVVRSAVLVCAVCIGRWLARPASALNSLAAGGLIVLAANPAQLFQVGTQLSFLAVATLIACGPLWAPRPPTDKLDRFLRDHEPAYWKLLRRFVSFWWRLWLTGCVVWLVLLPLTMYWFHLLSPSGLWLNMVLWIPIAVALCSGFGALTIGWLLPPLGKLLAMICDGCLWAVEECIAWGEQSFGSYYWIPGPSLWWVLCFYGLLGLYLVLKEWRPARRVVVMLGCLLVVAGAVTAQHSPLNVFRGREPQLQCTFIAVGHGTSVLVELPDGGAILYDAGHMGTPHSAAQSIAGVLWSRGITRLEAIVISHADGDHYNAVPELLRRFAIGTVYVSPFMFRERPPGVAALRQAIEEHHVPIQYLHRGQRLELGDAIRCDVLHPPSAGSVGSDNANSITLALEVAGERILLPGDLESPGLEELISGDPLVSSVVMAPHHGSTRSNPLGFAQWTRPRWVTISGARSRDATEVVDAYRSYGADVLHTGHDGAVRVTIDNGELTVETWQESRWQVRRHRAEEER